MAAEVTVRIIFYGLMALVPNDAEFPDAVSFVLADATGHQYISNGCKVPEHRARIYVAAKECKDFVANQTGGFDEKACGLCVDCKPPIGTTVSGAWPLAGYLVTTSIPDGPEHLVMANDLRPSGSVLPKNKAESEDISWVPEVSIGNVFNEKCLFGDPDCPVSSRFIVDQGRLTTCHLADLPTGNPNNPNQRKVCAFDFRNITSSVPASDPPAAMADVVKTTLEIPQDKRVTIELRKLGGDKIIEKIELKGGRVIDGVQSNFIDIWVINVPKPTAVHGNCGASDADGHFELYYNLSRPVDGRPISLLNRPVPHSKQTKLNCVLSTKVQPSGDDACPILTLSQSGIPDDKVACPTRMFSPVSSAGDIVLPPPPPPPPLQSKH